MLSPVTTLPGFPTRQEVAERYAARTGADSMNEMMNEPVADDPEKWNDLLARVRDSIRSWEPERVLVIARDAARGAAIA